MENFGYTVSPGGRALAFRGAFDGSSPRYSVVGHFRYTFSVPGLGHHPSLGHLTAQLPGIQQWPGIFGTLSVPVVGHYPSPGHLTDHLPGFQ